MINLKRLNALSHKLERRSLASYYTLTTNRSMLTGQQMRMSYIINAYLLAYLPTTTTTTTNNNNNNNSVLLSTELLLCVNAVYCDTCCSRGSSCHTGTETVSNRAFILFILSRFTNIMRTIFAFIVFHIENSS